MAIQHNIHNIYGVQFHPESIMTDFGLEMLVNFLNS
jgi:anthranilate/para-aminobenzoate synthase component II